ncbi:MAG: CCA tRNA nucleotidyltransferase [Firmicutes bacterium]|jgi:putative nucleotidyltransferase with HDIG domain|nr:CCA tRNA nucleotidyltransferase [Bacillota bacterium]MDH7495413.1 CCA tRNA nucleotidyltransferase [Bacillota bacterium]
MDLGRELVINENIQVPENIQRVARELEARGHRAYLVGGAVRDSLLGKKPKDWDICTSATPDEVEEIFHEHASRTGKRYGTITVLSGHDEVEVTTFRRDGRYTDGRRPEVVVFSSQVTDDLARRDFTVNAMAFDIGRRAVLDCFGGLKDLRARLIRAVGNPRERFQEDALRMLRAIRLGAELGFELEPETLRSIEGCHESITRISWERIRDELSSMIVTPAAGNALSLTRRTRLLEHILPELEACVSVPSGAPSAGNVFEHSLKVTDIIEPTLHLRLAALLHDIGKPATMERQADGTLRFPCHEKVGASLALGALERLRYPRDVIKRVVSLVERHMFSYDPATTDKGIRRMAGALGMDFIRDLGKLREADRMALGAEPGPGANMAAFLSRVESVMANSPALSVRDLAVNGRDVMSVLGVAEGPKVGQALTRLLEAVLENPSLNSRDVLLGMLREMKGT